MNANAETKVCDSPLDMELTLQDHRRFKHAKDVPPDAVIQFLKPSMLGQIIVHHKHVLTLPSSFLNEPNDAFGEVKMMASKAYSIKQFWYVVTRWLFLKENVSNIVDGYGKYRS